LLEVQNWTSASRLLLGIPSNLNFRLWASEFG
jgi:hypothetical protein